MSAHPTKRDPSISALQARSISRSQSRSTTRPRYSRNTSFVPENPEALLSIDGTVGEETAELLQEFVHPHRQQHEAEETLNDPWQDSQDVENGSNRILDEDEDDRESWKARPWYKRPSPWWLICMMPFTAIAMTATVAPRIEIYTELVCRDHKPDYSVGKETFGPQPYNMHAVDMSIGGSAAGYPLFSPMIDILPKSLHENDFIMSIPPFLSPLLINSSEPTGGSENDEGGDGDGNSDEVDPSLCFSDPDVQAAVAEFIVLMSSSMGILSCLTTGWWGSFSDRYGRLRIMGITVIGLLLTDYNFIFVAKFSQYLPGRYYFLLLGPVIEGALGGMNSAIAANHAYLADCTTPASRARIFSLSVGLMFVGIGLGPTLGGLLVKVTQSSLSVFYLAAMTHTVYALLVWFVIPESLGKRKMMREREKKRLADIRARNENYVTGDGEDLEADRSTQDGNLKPCKTQMRVTLKKAAQKMFGFLSPLAVLAPRSVEVHSASGKKAKKDWNMVFVGLSHGLTSMIVASYQYKFQFLAAQFHWTSEELGYLITWAGVTRATYLTLLLPIAIRIFKRKKQPIQLPVDESEPLHPDREAPEAEQTSNAASTPGATHDAAFDLGLARFSLFIECITFILMATFMNPAAFFFLTGVVSLASGFGPALQSLALELFSRHNETETGKLFGALSVLSSISSQIIGPTLFGITYMNTVKTFPRTIFFVTALFSCFALLSLSLIRIPKHDQQPEVVTDHRVSSARPGLDRERTLVDPEGLEIEAGESLDRGRKSAKVPGSSEDV